MLIVRTPVRISFAGGGTDLPAYYSQRDGVVVSSTINKYFYTILTERDDDNVQMISADLQTMTNVARLDELPVGHGELDVPLQVLREFRPRRGLNLFLASEVPPGTGLGSSASVCVNVIKALSTHLGASLSRVELAERAFEIASVALGKPVGKQDEYAAAFGGLNRFRFTRAGVQVDPVRLDLETLRAFEERLLLFFTGSARNSEAILRELDDAMRRPGAAVVRTSDELAEIAEQFHATLLGGDLDRCGRLLHHEWEVKQQLSPRISSEHIDRLYAAARAAGATGGKITGAGGGGFLLLDCAVDRQEAVRTALRAAGAREMSFAFDDQGAKVVYNDPFFDASGRGGSVWRFVRFADDLAAGGA
ncbi:MAG TPA: GHMP kinase [Candidatus Kryptonia bacterium]|nr:GHMP kinase [Candidatus Kryptonia bacterium]